MTTPAGTPATPNPVNHIAAIRAAAKAKEWDKVMDLIDHEGVDPNQKYGNSRRTLAQYAAYKGELGALKQLQARGAQLEGINDKNGLDVIHSAVRGTRYDVIEWLAKQGVNLDACMEKAGKVVPVHTPYGPGSAYTPPRQTPIQMVIGSNNHGMMRHLLDLGASADGRDNDGETPLMKAVERMPSVQSNTTVNLLLAYGADVNAVNDKGESVIMHATKSLSYRGYVERLHNAGAELDNPDTGKTLLEYINGLSYTKRDEMEEAVKARYNMPSIDVTKAFTKSRLFKQDANGLTPLDNPQTWRQMGTIMRLLADQGQPLTKRDFLDSTNLKGEPWIYRAIDCRAYNAVADALTKQGTPMKGADFADTRDKRKLNRLGEYAFNSWLGKTDFGQKTYWQDKGAAALNSFCNELPPILRDQISNRFQLAQSLQAQANKPTRGR